MSPETKEINRILDFWFGDLKENEIPSDEYRKKWWIKDSENDMQIKNQFGNSLELAKRGALDGWEKNPNGSLALIILLDQFSRNIFRNNKKAFSQDEKALQISLTGIEKGYDREFHPVKRVFYYMPFIHSELMEIQEISIECFSNLANEFTKPESIARTVTDSLEYALKHYEIVKRFGRYPHRNAIMERESTFEEIEFLNEPESSF